MKSLFLILACLSTPLTFAQTPQMTGRDVVLKGEEVGQGFHDEQSHGKMVIIGSDGSKAEREFTSLALEKSTASGAKALIKINKPADLNGVGLLNVQNIGRDDDQWFYLPSLKKTKRIAGGGSKSGSFIGSDFSFEDLSTRKVDDYDHALLRTEPCAATTCYVVESKPKSTTESIYGKSVSWIQTDNFMPTRAELYDKNGSIEKLTTFANYTQVNGKYWRAQSITMHNQKKNRETQLIFDNITIGKGLNDSNFSKAALER